MSSVKKKAQGLLMCFALLAAVLGISRPVWADDAPDGSDAAADSDMLIDRFALEIQSNIRVGEACSARDIEITVLNDGYEVHDVELLNKGQVWGTADVPRFIVYLRPEDGYTFALDHSLDRIKGAELEYVHWEDFLEEYAIQIRLPSLREQVGEIADASWSSETLAVWSSAYNTACYEVQLYCGDKRQGAVQYVSEPSCDFGRYMRAEGTYTFRVRAVNRLKSYVKSEWKESAPVVVDSAAAERLREQYPILPGSGPGQSASAVPYYEGQYGWIAEGSRWWYRNADGSYTTDDWQYIDDKWYYFDSKGYMVTGWIDWKDNAYYCDPESGAMLVSTIVPDGMGRRVDSTGAWIQ